MKLLKIYFSKCVAPKNRFTRTLAINVRIYFSFLGHCFAVVYNLLISARCRVITQKSQSYNPSIWQSSSGGQVGVIGAFYFNGTEVYNATTGHWFSNTNETLTFSQKTNALKINDWLCQPLQVANLPLLSKLAILPSRAQWNRTIANDFLRGF